MSEVTEIQREVTEWAKATFPNETIESKLLHMFEELEEAFAATNGVYSDDEAQEIRVEIADAASILLNHASDFNVIIPIKNDQLVKTIRAKLEVNKKRTWGVGTDGVCRHV